MKKRTIGAVVGAAGLAFVILSGAQTASAEIQATERVLASSSTEAEASSVHYFKSPTSHHCLFGGPRTDPGNPSSTGDARMMGCQATHWQRWEWYGQITPTVATDMYGVASQSCLDANSGGDVYMHLCNAGDNQGWIIYRVDSGLPRIQNYANRNLCLTEMPNNDVRALTCNVHEPKQRWRIVEHPAQ